MNLNDISLSFDPKGRAGLYHINLDLNPNELIAILGPNGAGKSTLLKLIQGNLIPQNGEIKNPFKKIIFFPIKENPSEQVYDYLLKSIDFDLNEDKKHQLVRDWAMSLEFTNHLKKKFSDLSLGNQSRVQLTACLINNPDCLLLDEPLNHLDPMTREQFIQDLKNMSRLKDITILWATHEKKEAFSYADKIILMQHGQIESMASPIELFEQPKNIFVAQMMDHQNLITLNYLEDSLFQAPWGKINLPLAPKKNFILLSIPETAFVWNMQGDYEITLQNALFQGAYYEVSFLFQNTLFKTHMSFQDFKSRFLNNKAQLSLNTDYFIYLDCLS